MFTTETVRQNREDICSNCNSKNGVKCAECNCFLIFLRKVSSAHCPLNKW